jgi:thymidylate synthase
MGSHEGRLVVTAMRVDLDPGEWVQIDNARDALERIENDLTIQWVLIEPKLMQSIPELFQLLQYRGSPCGISNGLRLYSMRTEEQMYLDMMNEVRCMGHVKDDRTHVGVRSLFGKSLKFSLKNNRLPLLTTKRVFFKGIAKELLWFLKGSSHNKSLQEDGIHIWDGNGSRDFLDRNGLTHYEEGELGPIYGYQWRSWGKPYRMDSVKQSEGIDQIQQIIHTIRTNPTDRRMILSAWNVSQIDEMALPPCHMMAQFYVHFDENNEKHLSCSMYQRSADIFLGVPFNIASYALLTHMLAHVTGCKAHELVMFFGDTHLYQNHTEQADIQLARYTECKAFPVIRFNPEKQNIDDFTYDDFSLIGYTCCDGIQAPMAV